MGFMHLKIKINEKFKVKKQNSLRQKFQNQFDASYVEFFERKITKTGEELPSNDW